MVGVDAWTVACMVVMRVCLKKGSIAERICLSVSQRLRGGISLLVWDHFTSEIRDFRISILF